MVSSRLVTAGLGALALVLSSTATANAAVIPTGALGLLAAGERASVFAATTENNTTTHNGSEWYFREDYSMGFAAEGATVNLTSADINAGEDAWSRLSWHLLGTGEEARVGDGYRLGENTGLNYQDIEDFDEEDPEEMEEYYSQPSFFTGRFVFTADTLPGYYPSGPQENVAVEDLDGWTLCWSNLYGDDSLELGSINEMLAACDGDYIMLAGGDMEVGDFADFNSAAEGLADTGFDATGALSAAAVLAAAGIVATVRRRRA